MAEKVFFVIIEALWMLGCGVGAGSPLWRTRIEVFFWLPHGECFPHVCGGNEGRNRFVCSFAYGNCRGRFIPQTLRVSFYKPVASKKDPG